MSIQIEVTKGGNGQDYIIISAEIQHLIGIFSTMIPVITTTQDESLNPNWARGIVNSIASLNSNDLVGVYLNSTTQGQLLALLLIHHHLTHAELHKILPDEIMELMNAAIDHVLSTIETDAAPQSSAD